MKKTIAVVKFLAAGVLALGLAGCSTVGHKTVASWQNKVWRGTVVRPLLDTVSEKEIPTDKDFLASTQYDRTKDVGLRLAMVHISKGWNSVMLNAVIPDSLELDNLPKGTLVDVMVESGPNANYRTVSLTRIIRVICAKDDEVCIKTEKDAGRFQAVVDEHPSNISEKYNLTFNRRATAEEIAKYK